MRILFDLGADLANVQKQIIEMLGGQKMSSSRLVRQEQKHLTWMNTVEILQKWPGGKTGSCHWQG